MSALFRVVSMTIALVAASATLHAQRDTITILHLNDTHSNMLPNGPRASDRSQSKGGLARAASVIGAVRQTDSTALLFHAGDIFMGDLFSNAYLGLAEIDFLSALGCTAMTLGNHEFDLSPAALLAVLDTAKPSFPLLCANVTILDPSVDRLRQYVFADTMLLVKGHRVGVFGMTSPEANLLSQVMPQAYLDTTLGQFAASEVLQLRARGCEAVIMLSHLGIDVDQMIAAAVPGLDAVIGGHDHLALTQPIMVRNSIGADVPVVQAGAFYSTIGRLRLVLQDKKATLLDWTPIALDASVPEEATVAGYLDLFASGVESIFGFPAFSEQVTTITQTLDEEPGALTAVGRHDTPVGNLVTDAFRDFTHTDIALTAGGSTAQPLYQGPIIPNDIMRMIGYGYNTVNYLGFRVVSFEATGAALAFGIEFGLSQIERSDEFFVQSSGLSYRYAPSLPAMSRLLPGEPRLDGQSLDPTKWYSVTGNEMMLSVYESLTRSMGFDTLRNIRLYNDLTEFQIVYAYLKKVASYAPVRRDGPVAPVADAAAHPATMLLGNSPNPVRNATTIVFDLPERCHVSLVLHDLQGREVARLEDGIRDAGRNSIPYDASSLAPGLYLYTVKAGNAEATQRLLKLR
jgi:5'-nucleotidase